MITRREAITRLAGLAGLGLLGPRSHGQTTTTQTITPAADKAQPLTVAHITDMHITYQRHAEEWASKCLHDIQSHPAKPSLILNTGDCILDSNRVDRMESDKLWKVWNTAFKRESSLPMKNCLGNHDIWGLHLQHDHPAAKDPMFGKKLSMDYLGMDKLYYSFDQGGWHFIMLDSVFSSGPGRWKGQLDDEQFHWLENDLKNTPATTPIMVCTHMPIIQMCTMPSMKPTAERAYEFSANIMMADARRIIDLFKKHSNIKLCFSGHIHRLDRLELSGVTYICDGAVCGSKWQKLAKHTSQPGYSITTLHPDGTFDYQYESIGWTYKA